MGLLDNLFQSGDGIGGLLSYLQGPQYIPPSSDKQFLDALKNDPYGGSMLSPPQQSVWDQPGINYAPAPSQTASPFNGGAAPIMGLPSMGSAQGAPQGAPPAPPQMPQAAPMAPPPPPQAPQLQPNPAVLPPNSAPTQGQSPPQPETPLPPALGGANFGGNFGAGLQSFVNTPGGLLPKLLGGINAGITGQRSDPAGLQQQNLKAQFDATRQALIDNGVDHRQASSTAMLAVLNPEAAKTILPELLTNKEKYQVISEDPLEGKKYGFVNDRQQTINGQTIGQQGQGGQSPGLQGVIDKISAMKAQGASKQELLAAIPNGYREDVGALVGGKALPANMGRAALRGPLNILAHAVDENYDETQIPGRVQMRKDFMGEGKNGQAISSFNTAQHHMDKLSDDLETLAKFHGNYPAMNSMKDWFSAKANTNPQLRDTVQSVKTDMAAVSHEVGNAYNAGHLSDHDMATWNALTQSDLPPDQLRRGLADFVDLLNGKRDSLNHMYRQQFGEDAPSIEKDKNEAITKKVHQRSPQYDNPGGNSTKTGVTWSIVK